MKMRAAVAEVLDDLAASDARSVEIMMPTMVVGHRFPLLFRLPSFLFCFFFLLIFLF